MTFLAKLRRPRQDDETARSRKAVGCAGWVRRLCQATTDGAGVPDEADEALRDLVCAPAVARTDRRLQRLRQFLLRLSGRPPAGVCPWRQPRPASQVVLLGFQESPVETEERLA